jgi:hypothetical protein
VRSEVHLDASHILSSLTYSPWVPGLRGPSDVPGAATLPSVCP